MENLAQLQTWLRWIITHPHGVEKALLENSNEPLPRALDLIADLPPLPRTARLDIYAEGYYSRILEVLSGDFEHLERAAKALVGEDAFRKLVAAYLQAHPSRTKTVCDIGEFMPNFLQNYPPFQNFPVLAEISAMDWAATRALYIDSLPQFNPQILTLISEEGWFDLTFELEPSLQFLDCNFPLDQIWNEPEFNFTDLNASATHLIIFRQTSFVFVQSISSIQKNVLEQMRSGNTLGEICYALEEAEIPSVMEWFRAWTANGVIKNVKL